MPMNPKVLAIIPARGGSKGLPRKNVLPAGGRPLIAWTIEAALNADCVSRVVLSSDDDEIIAVAKEYGCDVPFKRPAALASDEAATMGVVLHALTELRGYDYVVLLQPTSPLRNAKDIDAAFERMMKAGAPSCVSVCPVEEPPYWMYQLGPSDRLRNVVETPAFSHRRQDLPDVYILNGAIYISRVDELIKSKRFVTVDTVGYVMPRDRSIDIDTRQDFEAFKTSVET